MGDTVDALKLKIKEQGGSTAGIHTIPQAIERLDIGGEGSNVKITYDSTNQALDIKTR